MNRKFTRNSLGLKNDLCKNGKHQEKAFWLVCFLGWMKGLASLGPGFESE